VIDGRRNLRRPVIEEREKEGVAAILSPTEKKTTMGLWGKRRKKRGRGET